MEVRAAISNLLHSIKKPVDAQLERLAQAGQAAPQGCAGQLYPH